MSCDMFISIAIIAVVILDVIAYILIKAYAKNNKIEDDVDGEELT